MARLRGSSWTADARKHGGRRIGGFATKARAERYEAEAKVAAESGLAIPDPDLGTGAAADPTFHDALKAASKATWGGCRTQIQNEVACFDFAAVLAQGRATPVRAVNDAHLLTWAAQLEARGNSAATVNRKLSAVSAVMDYAHKANMIGRKPTVPWRMVEGGRIVVLTPEQVDHFGSVLPEAYSRFMVFLLETGMRRGEATKFRVGDVGYTDGLFHQDPIKVTLPGDITKSGKTRVVPLTRTAAWAMRPYLHTAASPMHDGRPWGVIDPDLFTDAFRKVRLASPWKDQEDLTPHALRHTCATRLIQKGLRPTLVQSWLGHATLEQTLAYVHETEADLTAAAAAL